MQTNEQYFGELESIAKLFIEKGILVNKKDLLELSIKFSIGQSLNDFNLALFDQGNTQNHIVEISNSLEEIAKGIAMLNSKI
jgi:hypothetical protein